MGTECFEGDQTLEAEYADEIALAYAAGEHHHHKGGRGCATLLLGLATLIHVFLRTLT